VTNSWHTLVTGPALEKRKAIDALTSAGFTVEVSPAGSYYEGPDDAWLGVVLRDTLQDRPSFIASVTDAVSALPFHVPR
jgi:hypothetical protein